MRKVQGARVRRRTGTTKVAMSSGSSSWNHGSARLRCLQEMEKLRSEVTAESILSWKREQVRKAVARLTQGVSSDALWHVMQTSSWQWFYCWLMDPHTVAMG